MWAWFIFLNTENLLFEYRKGGLDKAVFGTEKKNLEEFFDCLGWVDSVVFIKFTILQFFFSFSKEWLLNFNLAIGWEAEIGFWRHRHLVSFWAYSSYSRAGGFSGRPRWKESSCKWLGGLCPRRREARRRGSSPPSCSTRTCSWMECRWTWTPLKIFRLSIKLG